MLPIKSFWRVGSRSYSRLYNLCLTESEVKFVESQTKHILDNANLDRDSDQIVQEYVNTKLKDIHPDFTNRNAICPIKLEGMVKALEFYQLVPQDMALFCKQHQIGMVASLYFISQVEELAKENILQFSESQSISCATLEKWRERVREVLETCGFKEQGEKLKLQDLNKKSVTRSDLFELLCPDLKKEVRGKVEPSHPVDAIRILELQRSLNTPAHFDLTRFTSSLDWLVQINVCREILGDEKAAVFHLHEHVALPITFHFLRHLGLSEKLCKEALCTPLKIWPSKPPHAKSSRNPKTHLKKLRKIFDDPCHDLSLMCHMYPTLSKIPRDVLINGLEELSRKDLNNCSLPLKTELLKYVLFKNASFDGDKLSQINQKRNHVDCLFNYMVPTQTFEDLGEPNSTFEDSRYFLAAGLSDNAVRLRQNARNLCTLQQTRRAFSTSTCSKRIALTFDGEPNFTKWVRVQMYIVFLRNSFDYNFDKKDFLKGCEMALITITRCVKDHQYGELKDLFSLSAKNKLVKEVELEWSEIEKNNIEISLEDLKKSQIERIDLDEERSTASIIVSYTAVKKKLTPPIFIACNATFTRDYSVEEGSAGWVISDFKLTQFHRLDDSKVLK